MFKSLRKASLFTIGGAMILSFALLGASGAIKQLVFPTGETCYERSSIPSSFEVTRKKVLDQLPMPLLKCISVDIVSVLPPSRDTDTVINDGSIDVQTNATRKEFEEFYDSWITKNNWHFGTSTDIPIFIWNGQGRLARDREGNLWIFIPPTSATNRYRIIFRKSYELLVVARAEKLDGEYIGMVAFKSFTRSCFERLLAKKSQYWNEFVELTKTGTPVGRVYGARLLYATDPIKAKPILNKMLSDTAELQDQYGCCIGRTTVKAEVADLLKTGKSRTDE